MIYLCKEFSIIPDLYNPLIQDGDTCGVTFIVVMKGMNPFPRIDWAL